MYDSGLGRWFGMDPLSENYYSFTPYSYCANSPIILIDPTGETMDWYSNDDETALLWRDSKKKEIEVGGETYHNVGSTMSFNFGGLYFNYYQNILASTSTSEIDVMNSLLNNPSLFSKLLGKNSPLSEDNKLELLVNSMHRAQQDFVDHPVTQAAIHSLLFVGTGGIEGMAALGSIGKGLLGNIRIPIYRVYGGQATMYGRSYSLFNPKYIPKYRSLAGLPNVNTGQYLLKGYIPLKQVKIGRLFAAPLDGRIGGLPFELYQNYTQLIRPMNVLLKKPF